MKELKQVFIINDQEYPAVFNTFVMRKYSEARNIKTVDESIRSLLSMMDPETDEAGNMILVNGSPVVKSVKWDGLDNIMTYVFCGITEAARRAGEKVSIAIEDVYALADNQEGMQQIIQLIAGQMPTPVADDPEPQGK